MAHLSLSIYIYISRSNMQIQMHRWPAMVEEDPDEETYYEMGDQNSNSVPVSPVKL